MDDRRQPRFMDAPGNLLNGLPGIQIKSGDRHVNNRSALPAISLKGSGRPIGAVLLSRLMIQEQSPEILKGQLIGCHAGGGRRNPTAEADHCWQA